MGDELWLLIFMLWMLMAYTPIILIIALLLLLIGKSNVQVKNKKRGLKQMKIGGFLLKSIVLLWLIPLLWLALGFLFNGNYSLIIPVSVFLFVVVARIFFRSSGDKKESEKLDEKDNEENEHRNAIIRPSIVKLSVIVLLFLIALYIIAYTA